MSHAYIPLLRVLPLVGLLACSGCSKDKFWNDPIDRGLNLRQNQIEPLLFEADKKKDGPLPTDNPYNEKLEMAPLMAEPEAPLTNGQRLVSLSVTEDVPLKDVLIELGRLAELEMQIDPKIEGGIILKVKDRPLEEVITYIAKQAGLRYSVKDGVMEIERDTPYVVNYSMDFLNLTRTSTSSVSTSTGVGSSGGSGSGSSSSSSSSSGAGSSSSGSSSSAGTASGSTNTLNSKNDADLLSDVMADITQILNPSSNAKSGGSSSSAIPPRTFPGQSVMITPAEPSSGTAGAQQPPTVFATVNKQAGIITVLATSQQQKQVKTYLDKVREKTTSQVMIEAKVVEITLSKEYHTGINWNLIDPTSRVESTLSFATITQNYVPDLTLGTNNALAHISRHSTTEVDPATPPNLDAAVQMMELFGETRTLSSPRLNAVNNQQAVLSFATNQVYFTLSIQQTPVSGTTNGNPTTTYQTNVSSTLNTVPIGIILALQPSINLETDEITMNIRPTISQQTSQVSDPAVTYIAAMAAAQGQGNLSSLQSNVPVVEVKEVDSIIRIKSGQIMVIGGMMQEVTENADQGIPFLQSIPVAGNLFKAVNKNTQIIQTVILIKATIVHSRDIREEDIKFYQHFSRDSLPHQFTGAHVLTN